MSIKPIIFSTPMVQAILDGRKTQTRRVIKITWDAFNEDVAALLPPDKWDCRYRLVESVVGYGVPAHRCYYIAPRYQPGDILWVRETWANVPILFECGCPSGRKKFVYKASDDELIGVERWRSPIHMPRAAARLFLRVTNVRAERLKDIHSKPLDYKKEGITLEYPDSHYSMASGVASLRNGFVNLWDSINAKRDGGAYAWERNPWVWVYEFEQCEKPEGWCEG